MSAIGIRTASFFGLIIQLVSNSQNEKIIILEQESCNSLWIWSGIFLCPASAGTVFS